MYTRSSLIAHGWIYQDTAALLEAVKMLGESEDKVERLWSNVDYLNKGFTALGFDIGTHTVLETRARTQTCVLPLFCALDLNRFNTVRDTLPNQAPDTFENENVAPFFCFLSAAGHSETPIIPVMLGDEDLAREFSARLFEEGVFASAIWYFSFSAFAFYLSFCQTRLRRGAVLCCVCQDTLMPTATWCFSFLPLPLSLFSFLTKTVCFVGQLSDGAAGDGACACDCLC